MSRVVILGASISGHTAAAFARKWLGSGDTVTVVSPNEAYNWIPSNIWMGVGLMGASQVTFPLAPVYERHGIEFKQAAAREIHPEGDAASPVPFVTIESAAGLTEQDRSDFLINATGPRLRFDKTEGLARAATACRYAPPARAPGVGRTRRVRRADAPRRAAAVPGRRRPRNLHLRRRGL